MPEKCLKTQLLKPNMLTFRKSLMLTHNKIHKMFTLISASSTAGIQYGVGQTKLVSRVSKK